MDLSNISEEVTETQNVAGQMTPIMEISPQDGTLISIAGMVNRGREKGVPLFAELFNSSGDPLPADTDVAIMYERPDMDQAVIVSEVMEDIRSYLDLSIQDQQNEDYVDRTKHVLKGTDEALANGRVPALNIRDIDTAYVAIESSEQVDWTQGSRVQFSSKAVEER